LPRLRHPEGADEALEGDNVYLSRQTLDIMIALKTCAGNSRYLLPSRYDADAPMSRATFNRVTYSVVELAKKEGLPLEPFTVHDLRRTGSTLLNELGFNSDWIEKCLAHEDGRSSRGVYNKAEYEVQRRHMMQEWSDIIDAWVAGKKRVPVLIPPSMPPLGPDPALEPSAIAVGNVGMLRTGNRSGSTRGEPCFDFAQMPYDTSRRECEASWELATLFHLIDRAVGEGHHRAQLLSTDRPFDRCLAFRCHRSLPWLQRPRMKAIVAKRWKILCTLGGEQSAG
jgi:hypothetical protein